VGSSALLTNCIVWANLPSEMVKDATSAFTVSYSDVKGGMAGTGNLNLDPKLLAPEIGNYHLMRTSPCIDTGQNESAPETDREGTLRPADGNGDGTPVVDMGAYEGLPTNLALVPRSGWEVNGIEGGPFSPDMKQ